MPYYNNQAEFAGIISHIRPLDSLMPRFFITGDDCGQLTIICPSHILTKKEWVIAFLIMQGFSEQEIATKLNRTMRTVKFHKGNILSKTQCETSREFLVLCRKNKWQFYIPPLFSKPCYIFK